MLQGGGVAGMCCVGVVGCVGVVVCGLVVGKMVVGRWV